MSTFSDIRDGLIKIGLPLLGAALPLPGGAALGTALAAAIGAPSASPSDILAHLSANSDAVQKAMEFQETHEETILKINTEAEIRAIEAVNKTMQGESASDHWPTYSWRPFIGFCVGFNTAVASLLVLMVFVGVLLNSAPAIAAVGQLPMVLGALAAISATVLPILGIASYFRGKAQADPNIPTDNRG